MRANCWIIKPKIKNDFLEKFPEHNAATLQLLFNRGLVSQEDIDIFFGPDYDNLHDAKKLKDVKKAVKRVLRAIKNKEKIVIYGDYDADGVCGSTILYEALKKLGANVGKHIPDRNKEGYGLNIHCIEFLAKEKTNLIITVDCGVSDYNEVELANKLGIDVIITDHHTIPPKLPEAYAVINPRQKGDKYPFKDLSGTGVAFKFVKVLLEEKGMDDEKEKWFLDLVAIATITDRMLMLGENRILVKYGLVVLARTKRVGLRELLKSVGRDKIVVKKSSRRKYNILGLSTRDIGFVIGPRINAAGRIDHANTSFELLNTKDKKEAEKIVKNLTETNQKRQNICEKIFNELVKKIGANPKEKIIIEGSIDWPMGIVGLIAGKISEKYHRPCLIYRKEREESNGSARTIKSFNIMKALRKAGDLLGEHGGHAMAAGFHIQNKNILAFKKRMQEIANKEIKDKDLVSEIEIDMELNNISGSWWDLYETVEDFKPFGPGNEEPVFLLKDCIVNNLRVVGNGSKHLKININYNNQSLNCIGFRLGEWYDKIRVGDKIDIVFNLMLNEWNGSRSVELCLVDLRKSEV